MATWDWHGQELVLLKPKKEPESDYEKLHVIVVNKTQMAKLPNLHQAIEGIEKSGVDTAGAEFHFSVKQVIPSSEVPKYLKGKLGIKDLLLNHTYRLDVGKKSITWEVEELREHRSTKTGSNFVSIWKIIEPYL